MRRRRKYRIQEKRLTTIKENYEAHLVNSYQYLVPGYLFSAVIVYYVFRRNGTYMHFVTRNGIRRKEIRHENALISTA